MPAVSVFTWDGVEKDVDYAIKLINDAAELGSVKAKDYIINHKI